MAGLIIRQPYVGASNFYQEILIHYQDFKNDTSEVTRNPEEIEDIITKIETFYNTETKNIPVNDFGKLRDIANLPQSEKIMFEDTEKSQSLRNSLIDFQNNFKNLSTKEQRLFTLLLLVNAEFFRKELLGRLLDKTEKNTNTNISDNKFFQLAEYIGDFRENIYTENIIEHIKQDVEEILNAHNIEQIREMNPIENFVEEDFVDIIKKITAEVAYTFHSGKKKEKKELSKIITHLEKSKNIPENELGNYLKEISEDGKRKNPNREIITKDTN